jgi:hypothetical protein
MKTYKEIKKIMRDSKMDTFKLTRHYFDIYDRKGTLVASGYGRSINDYIMVNEEDPDRMSVYVGDCGIKFRKTWKMEVYDLEKNEDKLHRFEIL